MIDGSGAYLQPHLTEVSVALKACSPEDADTRKLLAAAKLALEFAAEGRDETPELVNLSNWVHKKFIRGYFRDIAGDFDTNPYFGEDG